jgi:hypothetical protein
LNEIPWKVIKYVKKWMIYGHILTKDNDVYTAAKARAMGYRGISSISEICGLSRLTITSGINEILSNTPGFVKGRVRAEGSGRPTLLSNYLTLIDDLQKIQEGSTRGDP